MLRVVIFALLLVAAYGPAQGDVSSEAEIKAAYLYNFTRFVQWKNLPETSELSLCVLNDREFWDALQPISGRSAQGRSITLSFIERFEPTASCDVLFVSLGPGRELSRIVEQAAGAGIMTVSDVEGFVDNGGVIGYVKQGNVIKFEINLEAARASELTFNSRLLELAVRVIR